jgi:hypothetical protein
MKSKVHIFPHSYLPGPAINKIISFFGPVNIYQPWFIDDPDLKGIDLEIIKPPDNLKPKEDVKAILSGYRNWAELNHDRSRQEILKFGKKADEDESATWEIRRLLRGAAQPAVEITEEEMTLKWHLLLHLAHEIERQNMEIMDMMNALKKKGPVLAGVLQDPGESRGILDDSPGLMPADMPDNLNTGRIVEAWFGLFNGYASGNDLLITYSNRVMDYFSSRWDDEFADNKAAIPQYTSFRAPDFSLYEPREDDKTGKLRLEAVMKIRELILGLSEDPEPNINRLGALTRGLEEAFPSDLARKGFSVGLRHFPAMDGGGSFEGIGILKHITGKTIILVSAS